MKKYLFGFLAVVLALGFSAFTKKQRVEYTFVYQAPQTNPYSQGNVQTESLWKQTTADACAEDFDDLACTIVLDEDFVPNPGADQTLNVSAPDITVHAPTGSAVPVTQVRELDTPIAADIIDKEN